jgi:hypothetical protein
MGFYDNLLSRFFDRYRGELIENLMVPLEQTAAWRMSMRPEQSEMVGLQRILATNYMVQAESARNHAEEMHARIVAAHDAARVHFRVGPDEEVVEGRLTEAGPELEVRSVDQENGAVMFHASRRGRPGREVDTRPWAHLKSRDGWTKRIRVDSDVADHLIVPEPRRGVRYAHPSLDGRFESDRIDSVEYRKVREVLTRDLRAGTQKVEYWFEEV